MAVAALIIGVLMMLAGLVVTLMALRRAGDSAPESNRYSTGMALIGLGCLVMMGSLLLVW